MSVSKAGIALGPCGGLLRELLDQASGDLRREQRVAVGHDAHRVEEVVGERVLEQEAARPGLERAVDVLVEVEGGEDQDPGVDLALGDRPGRLEAVHLGHADVHQDDVGSLAHDEVDGLDAVGRLTDDLDVVGGAQQHGEPAAHERLVVGDGDADHPSAPNGSRAATRKPPPTRGPASSVPP